ncbi:MAG: polysaccharide biosynthesis/export family protein [Pirellulales bacterium]
MDALQISVEGTLPDQPINGIFVVEPSGLVSLGPGYGKAMVGGLPLEEAEDVIESMLRRSLREPQVSLTLAEAAGLQQIFGQHQVAPDGTINLGIYGTIPITGLTVEQATETINTHLEKYLENPSISLDIYSYSSKKFYVVIAGAGTGDSINSFPCTGSDTVLDAIALVQGTGQFSNKKIWIARPGPGGAGCDQVLPVDYDAIVRGGSAATNYQIFPGDRVYFEDSKMIAFTNRMNRVLDPIQRVFGFALLGANAVQASQRFPDGNN